MISSLQTINTQQMLQKLQFGAAKKQKKGQKMDGSQNFRKIL